MDNEMRIEIGTLIAINRFPHDCKTPTHRVVGFRDDNYLRIRPINASENAKYARNPIGKGRILIETHIPVSDVIVFENADVMNVEIHGRQLRVPIQSFTFQQYEYEFVNWSRWIFKVIRHDDCDDMPNDHIVIFDKMNERIFACVFVHDYDSDASKERVMEYIIAEWESFGKSETIDVLAIEMHKGIFDALAHVIRAEMVRTQ